MGCLKCGGDDGQYCDNCKENDKAPGGKVVVTILTEYKNQGIEDLEEFLANNYNNFDIIKD